MLFVFGDSHAEFNMKGFPLQHHNLRQYSITMHRIGRDNTIVNFINFFNNPASTFLLFYGEVDCRCHIGKQIALGRKLDEIIEELVGNYFRTISNNIKSYKQIIIGSVTPPTRKEKYESNHGPVTHGFPFIGTDEERSLYTRLVNEKMKEYCDKYNYTFLDLTPYYADEDGMMIFEKSDTRVHIKDNKYVHDKIIKLMK